MADEKFVGRTEAIVLGRGVRYGKDKVTAYPFIKILCGSGMNTSAHEIKYAEGMLVPADGEKIIAEIGASGNQWGLKLSLESWMPNKSAKAA